MSDAKLTTAPIPDEIQEALAISLRGCDELLPQDDWVKKLTRSAQTGTPLRIKLGLDPTAPDIHIGHTVVLNKMRQLQDLGHQVIFLIGDFTTLIGDPSGRDSTRPPLTAEQMRSLKVGDVVLIRGEMYTGRDAVHAHLMKNAPPVDLNGAVLYHCGPVMLKEGDEWFVKAAGPTTSSPSPSECPPRLIPSDTHRPTRMASGRI